jgi:hypothetical protein
MDPIICGLTFVIKVIRIEVSERRFAMTFFAEGPGILFLFVPEGEEVFI